MSILSILGSLPGASSAGGSLNNLDYKKLLRMAAVIVASYCLMAILQTIIGDLSHGAFGIPEQLVTPLTGALTIVLEAIRRKYAAALQG